MSRHHYRKLRNWWHPLAVGMLLLFRAIASPFTAEAAEGPSESDSLMVAPGYEVNLFASEELGIANPIQIRFDTRGRAWVNCSWTYPQIRPGEEADDKIFILEDTDGDGRADRSSLFADGLFMPLGMALGDGGVYVGAGTKLLHLADTDGDDRADQRRVILRGFGTGDAHQIINSFLWGPGGELMFSQGLHAFSRVETPWGIERLHRAGIWRLRPRRLKLDGYLGQGVAPHNPWGFVFDNWGQPFVVAGNGHGIFYLPPAMVEAEHSLPFQPIWDKGLKFGGAEIIGSRHFPAEDQGVMVAGGYLNNAVFRFRLKPEGAGFDAKQMTPLVRSDDKSFRVVDVKHGPDGALYLADWRNEIIGHYQASFRHPKRDKSHGRIWRLTAKGRSPVPVPNLARRPLPGLLDGLKSSERWTRYHTKRELADRERAAVIDELNRWVSDLNPDAEDYEHHLYQALGVYESHEVVNADLLKQLLSADDHRARAYAARVIGHWHDRLDEPLELLAESVMDPHPRVRLEAVVASSYVPSAQSLTVALRAVERPMDQFLHRALKQTIHALKRHWIPALEGGQLALTDEPDRLEYLIATVPTPATLTPMVERLREPDVADDSKMVLARALAGVGDGETLGMLIERETFTTSEGKYRAGLHAEILKELAGTAEERSVRPKGDLPRRIGMLLSEGEPASLRQQAMRLAGLWEIKGLRDEMVAVARSDTEPTRVRAAAILALGRFRANADLEVLADLARGEDVGAVRVAALDALSRAAPEKAAQVAGEVLTTAPSIPAQDVFALFLQVADGSRLLAEQLKNVKLPAKARKAGVRLLQTTGSEDSALAEVLGASPKSAADLSEIEGQALAKAVRERGNPIRGKEVFLKPALNCLGCHRVNGVGAGLGPDLTSVGTGLSVELLIQAVLDPGREVKEGFMAFRAVTKDGRVYQGYKRRESSEALWLDPLLKDETVRLPKARIEEMGPVGSIMPDGLTAGLSREEVRDLIRYLSELGRPGSEDLAEIEIRGTRFE